MADPAEELNVSELDDGYLKVLLLLSARRASSSEPRRAGFWHGLADILSVEQERRQGPAEVNPRQATVLQGDELGELQAVLEELRRDIDTLEVEYRSAYGQVPPITGNTSPSDG